MTVSTARELFAELTRRGVALEDRAGKLRVDAPVGALTAELRAQLRWFKDEVRVLVARGDSPIIVDFETRSLAKLKGPNAVTGRAYAWHPSTEVLCFVTRLPSGVTIEWWAGEPLPASLIGAVESGAAVVAHNATGFDRHVWARVGLPEPSRWIDTLTLARTAGFAERERDLGSLGVKLAHRPKDTEGLAFTLGLSKPERKTGALAPVTSEQRARVLRYCRADVATLAAMWPRMSGLDRFERELREVDRRINDRGFAFDVELAQAVIDCDERYAARACADADVTPDVVASHVKLRARLATAGLNVPNVKEETLERALTREISSEARAIIDARLASSSIAAKKLRTALRRVDSDGRLRDSLVYYGAHTGRWGGRGFQPQNLQRGIDGFDFDRGVAAALARDIEALRALAREYGASLRDVIGTLVRPCIVARSGLLAVVDYGAIEARVLAWLADDLPALNVFRSGGDPYRSLASRIFDVSIESVIDEQRKLGKVAELGCGYGMGADRFHQQAEGKGVDWSAAPVTAEQVVETWRDAHPRVAGIRDELPDGRSIRAGGYWRELEQAARRAVRGVSSEVGVTRWERRGESVVCWLPSGRPIIYREARVEPVPGRKGKQFTYRNVRGVRTSAWGGTLAENVTQAVARDVLADALVRADRAAGFPTVLHVHDEIVAEVQSPDDLDALCALMTEPPPWAKDLPLKVEGFTASRYRK